MKSVAAKKNLVAETPPLQGYLCSLPSSEVIVMRPCYVDVHFVSNSAVVTNFHPKRESS